MFKRIGTLMKGFLSLFISGIEKSNPAALIEAEKENLRKQIARFNDNLASHAGFVERLLRQIKNLEQKEKEITARVAANIKAGNRSVAGTLALELQTIKSQLEENRDQMVSAEETYKKLLKTRDVAVNEAQAKIQKLKQLMSETEMMEAQADVVMEAQKRTASTMLQGPYYRGGVVSGIAKGRFKRTGDGAEHHIVFKGTQHGNRIAEIAFINEYGKKNQPARPFIKTANEQAAGEATEAAAKILHNWQESQ